MSFNRNFLFKELFPDFIFFIDKKDEYNILGLYNLTYEEIQLCYNILMCNFANSTVKYDTPDSFYRHFFLVFSDKSEEFIAKYNLVRKLKNLTIADLKIEIQNITNVANNNNQVVNNPLSEIIPFITSQSTSQSVSNDLIAINKGLNLYRDNQIYQYLKNFDRLFMDIFGTDYYFYDNREV